MRGLLGFAIGFILAADGFLFSLGFGLGVTITGLSVFLFKVLVH